MSKITKFSFFKIIFFLLISQIKTEKLRWVLEIFTTGARSPNIPLIKNKDYFNHEWEGSNELTGVGIRQQFLLGYRNRLRYIEEKKLINSIYDPREVYLVSIDKNCTIMSANAQVQGLFLPGTGPLLYKNQSDVALPAVNFEFYKYEKEILDNNSYSSLPNKMNVIPIHNFFDKEHYMELQNKNICSGNKKYYDENEKRNEIVNYLNEMTKKYGDNLKNYYFNDKNEDLLKDYNLALNIFDNIISLYYEGAEELLNITNNLNVTLDELLEDAYKFLNLTFIGNGINNDKEISINSMSPVFNQLLLWLNKKIEKDINGEENYKGYDLPSFVMYSVDNDVCGAFMAFLKNIFGTKINYTKFASNLYLELVRNDITEGKNITKEDYRIDYFFNDDFIISIPFIEFEKKINDNLKNMESVDIFCGFAKIEKKTNNLYFIVDIALGIISLVLIILIFVAIIRKRKIGSDNFNEKAEKLNPISELNV